MQINNSWTYSIFLNAMASLHFFATLNIAPTIAFAAEPAPTRYLSGHELCELTKENRATEIGNYVDVPLNYDTPNSNQTTSIYFWTHKKFNDKLPSVIYFVGGPGGTAHGSSIELLAWNVIYFDQRGSACSRFATQEASFDGRHYSSEMIARDAEEIRKKLRISKWSIYGHSYGTVPATIYGHLFPDVTTAVVLEGVVLHGSSDLWSGPRRLKILQNFYNSLDPELQNVVQKVSEGTGNEVVFSQIAFSLMYLDDSTEKLKKYLDDIKQVYAPSPTDPAPAVAALFDLQSDANEWLEHSTANYTALTCRELSAMDPKSNFFYVFKNGKFSFNAPSDDVTSKIKKCAEFGITPDSSLVHTYNSVEYPLQTPVTYLQGTTDGATTANMAVQHYKKVAQSQKQILIKINGGHAPNLDLLKQQIGSAADSETPVDPLLRQTQQFIFSQALQGKIIDTELLKKLNAASSLKWTETHRGAR